MPLPVDRSPDAHHRPFADEPSAPAYAEVSSYLADLATRYALADASSIPPAAQIAPDETPAESAWSLGRKGEGNEAHDSGSGLDDETSIDSRISSGTVVSEVSQGEVAQGTVEVKGVLADASDNESDTEVESADARADDASAVDIVDQQYSAELSYTRPSDGQEGSVRIEPADSEAKLTESDIAHRLELDHAVKTAPRF
jgi:hypothetical protein